MIAKAGFLLGAASFTFDLPPGAHARPDLYGTIGIDQASRYVVYRPEVREADPEQNSLLRHAYNVRSGADLVRVYRALDETSTRVAYWKVGGGVVSTFFDARMGCGEQLVDTDDGIRLIAGGIRIGRSKSGLPALELRSPVFAGNSSDPALRESIVFKPGIDLDISEVPWSMIQIWREPAFVRQGTGRWEDGDMAARSVTTSLGITTEVQGPSKNADVLARYAERLAASATPMD